MSLYSRGPCLDRRSLLVGAVAGLCLWPLGARAQNGARVTAPGERLRVIEGLGGNVLVWFDGGNAVVVDAGAEPLAERLPDMVDDMTGGAEVKALFNTHWHLDQVGANAAFRQRGAEILAHRKTFAHLSVPYYLPDEDRYQQPLPPAAHPTETFFTSGVREVAGSQFRFGHLLEAHTDGDIYVQFQDDNAIAAGDAISPLRDPILDWYGGGWLGGRIESLEQLLALSDADTRFVPSYGPTVDRAYVESELELMRGLYDILWTRVRAGESAEDILRSGALDALPRRFDDPMRLLYDCHKGMWAHYNTLSPDIV
jgi:glyoxylase-like metal-dependent hydrolase (beta-lactamase superfamily II)